MLAAVLGVTGVAPAAAPTQSWELRGDGRWQQVGGSPTTAPAQDAVLDRVESMLQAKQPIAAKRVVVAWLKANLKSPARDRGLYLLGQANFDSGNRIMSFYNFDELMDKHPSSRFFYPALDRQYDIADAYLRGYKRQFLGMWILGAKEEATEMLYRIQQRAPGSPIAEKSLLRVADYYYAVGDFDVAADAYAAYVRSYPRSPYLDRVRLRQAFSSLAQFRGVRFDATPVIDARQQLVDLTEAFPKLAEEENFAAIIGRIDQALAKKLLVTADFYRRTRKPAAAAYYYQYLVKTWPNSPEAAEARTKLPGSTTTQAGEAEQPATKPTTVPNRERQ